MSTANKIRIGVWVLFLVGGIVLGIFMDLCFFPLLFNSLFFHIGSFILGFVLLKLVLKASKTTGKYLAKKGRKGNIPKLQTNVLVTDGIYACMRHPMHLGLWFFPLSVALIVGSPAFIFIIAPVEMGLMLLMIILIEEREAVNKFGESYIHYKKEVPFFSFKRKCLRQLLGKSRD